MYEYQQSLALFYSHNMPEMNKKSSEKSTSRHFKARANTKHHVKHKIKCKNKLFRAVTKVFCTWNKLLNCAPLPPKMIKLLNVCINFIHFAPLHVLRLRQVPHLPHPRYGSVIIVHISTKDVQSVSNPLHLKTHFCVCTLY
jgi:hypothetical protein